MKELFFAATLLLVAGSASAQDNVVKLNILSPAIKTGSFFFEHKLNAASSVQLGAAFTQASIDEVDLSGFVITPEYRFYLSDSKEAPHGFYVGPYLRYRNFTLKYEESDFNGNSELFKASLNTFGGGVLIGHQWIFKQRFSLDTFLGPSYGVGSLDNEDNQGNRRDFSDDNFVLGIGFGIRSGVTFGVAF